MRHGPRNRGSCVITNPRWPSSRSITSRSSRSPASSSSREWRASSTESRVLSSASSSTTNAPAISDDEGGARQRDTPGQPAAHSTPRSPLGVTIIAPMAHDARGSGRRRRAPPRGPREPARAVRASRSSGQAGDGPALLELVREHEPELVIVDIRMPPTTTTEGLDAARTIREEFPETGILVLSAHVEVEQAMELLAGGERIGYLLKSRVTDVTTSSRPSSGSPRAARWSTRRSSRSSSRPSAATTRSRSSRRASARCWR